MGRTLAAIRQTGRAKRDERKRRHWYAKRKGIAALLRETLWGKESPLVDSDAENQAMDADAALQELGGDYVAYGLFTATVTLWDEDHDRVADKVKSVGRVLRSRGFVVAEETLNAVDAWLSSLPGQCYANLRQPPVSSLKFLALTGPPVSRLRSEARSIPRSFR